MYIYIYIYIWEKKTNKLQVHPYKPVSWLPTHQKSPDEWATSKQACRDELVVYLFFSPIYSSLYFYVLSTVLQTSSFTLYIYIYIYMLGGHVTPLFLTVGPKFGGIYAHNF